MLVNTRLLFIGLLGDLGIDLVCDVGSMDGSDAREFRRRLPRARIVALEPNPANLAAMRADPRLADAAIELLGVAASDADGAAPFFVVPADAASPVAMRGMSSLVRRDAPPAPLEQIQVVTRRLDGVLASAAVAARGIALWIDVEGKAFEALEGARGIAARVRLVHVEVESQPCIGSGQRLHGDVRNLLESLGFEEIATDHAHDHPQFNSVFVRRELPARAARGVRRRLWRARLRRRLVAALLATCPACMRRIAAWRTRRRMARAPAVARFLAG